MVKSTDIAAAWAAYLTIRDRSGSAVRPAAKQRVQADLDAARAHAEALTRRWKLQERDLVASIHPNVAAA